MGEISQIQAHFTKTLNPKCLNNALRFLTLSKSPEKALRIYNQMLLSPSHHDHFTFTFALNACALAPSSLLHKGREVHAFALKSGHLSDLFVHNSLLAFYSAARRTAACRRAFSDIPSPDVVSWTSLISALANNGHPGEALIVLASMDVDPNEITLVAALPACSRLKDVKLGKTLHGICLRRFGGHGETPSTKFALPRKNRWIDRCFGLVDVGSACWVGGIGGAAHYNPTAGEET